MPLILSLHTIPPRITSMFFFRRFFSGASPSGTIAMDTAKANIIEYIKDPRGVTMFSKSYCPYCKRAQKRINNFLGEYIHPDVQSQTDTPVKDEDQPYKVLELDLLQDQQTQSLLSTKEFVMDELKKEGFKPNKPQSSVPNIWIGGEQVGGCDDLMAKSDDWIKSKLEAAGAKLV